jgi:ABC-type sugar transport system ATPase subunit
MAVVFASSETEEVLALADRVIVCFAAGISVLSTADPAAVSRAMVGLA